jgi:hypothetical protein
MSSSDIKTVQIIGGTMDEMGKIKKPRRNTRRNRDGQQDGGQQVDTGAAGAAATASSLRGVSANIMLVRGTEPSSTSVASTAASINPAKWLNGPIPAPPQISPSPSYIPANPNQASAPTGQYGAQAGGSATDRHIKVELRKSKTPKKVHLNPKKQDEPKKELHKKHKTRKVRKVTLGVSTLHKRMTRAKKLREKVKGVPIQELKEQLVKKGLVKATSKAPESVLRQIAIDSQIVAGKAL